MNNARTVTLITLVLSAFLLLVLGLGPSALAAQSLRVLLEDTPWHRNIEHTIGDFIEQSGIHVDLEFMPEVQAREKVDLDLTAGTGLYDVFLTDQMYFQKFAKLGALAALDDFIASDSEFEVDDFPALALETNTFGGNLYGIPWRNAFNVLIYRKDILDQYGIAVPDTMEELMNAAIEVRQALLEDGRSEIYGIISRGMRGEGLNIWIIGQSFFPAWGGMWFDPATGEPTVNSPEMVGALDFYATLLQRAGSPDAAAMSWDDCFRMYSEGRGVFFIDSAIQASLLYDAGGDVAENTGTAVVPRGPAGTSHPGLYNPSYVMSEDSADKEAAWEFIKWATSFDQMLSDAVDGGNFEIARESVLKHERFIERFPYHELIEVVLESKKLAREERPMIIRWPEVGDIVGEVAQRAIAGDIDAQGALDEAQERIMNIYRADPEGLK